MTTLTLHPYQEQAVEYLRERQSAGLFLDMGLGKTCITLTALQPHHLPVLVTAPKRVAEHVWESETAKWRPDLTIAVAKGTPAQREKALTSGSDIVVIGRDNLTQAVEYARNYNTFVIDELSGFKSNKSIRFKVAKRIAKAVGRTWGLTGTPAPNGLMDLWSQVFLMDFGSRLGTGITAYRNRYFYPGRQLASGVVTEWNLRPGADKQIHRQLEDLCLSMGTEGRIELPPVTYNRVMVQLPPKVKRVYKSMKDDLVADLDVLGGEIHSAVNAAVLSSKLSQICAGFMYVDDADLRDGQYDVLHHEKVRAVEEIVAGTGSPVLVFYRFKAERDLLRAAFPDSAHTIDEPDIVERWNEGSIPILLAHPDSAGHGLNLQHGGHTIIWTTAPWSLEAYRQANKRLSRQGQKNPVIIHHLVAPRTVDEAVLQRLDGKASIEDALLNHLEASL